ncbi:MAG: hypothetical protein K9L88_17005 [Chromatiaceae bacterium]|nr:hypothetical protein [Chromatiaceae bacterium]
MLNKPQPPLAAPRATQYRQLMALRPGGTEPAPSIWRKRPFRSLPAVAAGLLGLTLALLNGCATSPAPKDGGFVSGVVGIAGGGYERRIDEREAAHRGALDAQARLNAEARALEQERAAVRSDLNRAQSRLTVQEQRVAQERARLQAANRRSAADQQKLERLSQAQARIDQAKRSVSQVKPDQQPVTDLKAQTRDIQLDLDEIDTMVGVIAGT